jgi:hypothetical protein
MGLERRVLQHQNMQAVAVAFPDAHPIGRPIPGHRRVDIIVGVAFGIGDRHAGGGQRLGVGLHDLQPAHSGDAGLEVVILLADRAGFLRALLAVALWDEEFLLIESAQARLLRGLEILLNRNQRAIRRSRGHNIGLEGRDLQYEHMQAVAVALPDMDPIFLRSLRHRRKDVIVVGAIRIGDSHAFGGQRLGIVLHDLQPAHFGDAGLEFVILLADLALLDDRLGLLAVDGAEFLCVIIGGSRRLRGVEILKRSHQRTIAERQRRRAHRQKAEKPNQPKYPNARTAHAPPLIRVLQTETSIRPNCLR